MSADVADRTGNDLTRLANACCDEQLERIWRGPQLDSRQRTLWGSEDEVQWQTPQVTGSGGKVFLISVDHHPRWRIPQCYFPDGRLRGRDDFVALATALVNRATRMYSDSPVLPELKRPLGAILHELFKNTHEWARTDFDDSDLARSVRGILVQRHDWTREQVNRIAQGSPGLERFVCHSNFQGNDGRLRFMELSVIDSGVGLAARRLRQAWSPQLPCDDELRACLECLQKHCSSSRLAHKGLGLHEVMSTLSSLNAFMRIRTGKLSLYRDFVDQPYRANESMENSPLFDWNTGTHQLTPLARAEGVLYTMLIPIPPI